ncbi:MAG: response regulator, partial [Spirochaetota bacterium]
MATVVVIEDDPGMCDLIDTILTRSGHRVIVAADAKEGAAIVSREYRGGDERILVITDIFMPDRDGLELTAELKRDYPELPIIAI